ncbi:MAG: glycosyl transferase family protein [Rhodospirillales bacterium]|nr:glycosyl transferase family protein [Rhodospirillales bacterium]MBO6785563.1 glycosyl transferase family protein [Rhodospirillales bacterium]
MTGFAEFTRIIGRGPTLSRPLTRDEAAAAMRHVLDDDVDPVQLGGFLLVLRQRGETAPELAGFVDAVRARLGERSALSTTAVPDIDWPSYADHHRQQPWFILSALLLAEQGYKVLMHGIDGEHDACAPTRPVLQALGITPAASLDQAGTRLISENLVYIGLENMTSEVERLFHYKPLLGVRSVANTFVRDLNPLGAASVMVGVVHAPYRPLHQETLGLLGQENAAVFKGVGGEAQRNPHKSVQAATLVDGAHGVEDWPALLSGDPFLWREEDLSAARVVQLWRGEISHPAAEASIVSTAAIALRMLDRSLSRRDAIDSARAMWRARRTAPALAV